MKQYTSLQPCHRRNISLSNKHSNSVDGHTKNHSWNKTVLVWIGILAFTLPVFRSGIKSHLTFVEFILNHTIFTKEPEFIPREDYETIFEAMRNE